MRKPIMPFCVRYPYIESGRNTVYPRTEKIIPLDVCAAAPGASFLDALAAAQDDNYEYLIFMGKVYDVITGVEAVSFQ